MASSVKDGELLMYKGHPLMRKENIIYYGSMEDRYIIMMQIATKVAVQLQQTSQTVRMKDRIVKKSEKNSLWSAMDIGSIWLSRALSAK